MCRNIRPLFNYSPPSTEHDIQEAALQFVRKISGYGKPSEVNQKVFDEAVAAVASDIRKLLHGLQTKAEPRNREEEIKRAREKSQERFGK
jgi:hypothetical protein